MKRIHRSLLRTLRNMMVADSRGCVGLNKLAANSNVEFNTDIEEIIDVAMGRKATLSALVGAGINHTEVMPSHPSRMSRNADQSIRMDLLTGSGVAVDAARWTSLAQRLQPTSRSLGLMSVRIADYEADGHGYMTSNGRLAGVKDFQLTGYVLGTEEQDLALRYDSPVLKGMIREWTNHPDITHLNDVKEDIIVNGNMVKGAKFPAGTVVWVAVYQQSPAAESEGLINLALAWQFIVRAVNLLSEEGWNMIEGYVRRNFSDPINLMKGLTDENAFQAGLARTFSLGLIPRQTDLMARFVSLARDHYRVHVKGALLRLYTDPRVSEGCISLPARFRKELKVGDKVTAFRLPFLGHEVQVLTVSDFNGLGVRNASVFTGDSDGDFLFVTVGAIVDPAKVASRKAGIAKWIGTLEVGVNSTGLTGLQASCRAAVSKHQIGIMDSMITGSVFRTGGKFSQEWALLMKRAQDAVDFIKKDIPGITFTERVPKGKGAHPFYRLLNGKIERFADWMKALDAGRKLHGKIEGPLGRLLDLVLENIPTPVFREFNTAFNTQYYPKHAMPAWGMLLKKASPVFIAKVQHVSRIAQLAGLAIAHRHLDIGIKALKTIGENLASDPKGRAVADFIAMNVVCGNPTKTIGSGKVLNWLDVNEDIVRYYNWLRKRSNNTGEASHFEPDYGYRSVKWIPR